MTEQITPHVRAACGKLMLGHGFGPTHQLARDAALGPMFTATMLDGLDLHVLPVLAESTEAARHWFEA
jgi:hypothetical protein